MIEIKVIQAEHKDDILLPNQPFCIFGRMVVEYRGQTWHYRLQRYAEAQTSEMSFPDEAYDFDRMTDSVFLGAYDGERCVGLAVLQAAPLRYMYLYDLKVDRDYRRAHIGRRLLEQAKAIAAEKGYCGIYTQAQDDNAGACLFYLSEGFQIGGLDTHVYRHSRQAGKSDILFYCDLT